MPLRRSSRIELLDQADTGVTTAELRGNLRDIRRANRFFGGTRAVLLTLPNLIRQCHDGVAPVTILDLATGSADIPLAIAARADVHGWDVRITATDAQTEIVAIARAAERERRVTIEQADARDLPYGNGSFDIVLLSLALHHFDSWDAKRVLGEMRRVGRRALVVNDLERSRAGLAGAWLFSRALTTNRLTRHDAPLSVRRAYTPREAQELAHEAGWTATSVRRVAPFRFVMTGRP